MSEPEHILTSSYERLGDENVVVTRCTKHPNFSDSTFTWPTQDQLRIIAHKHDPEYDWEEHYRWH